jgi:hypothetical protein
VSFCDIYNFVKKKAILIKFHFFWVIRKVNYFSIKKKEEKLTILSKNGKKEEVNYPVQKKIGPWIKPGPIHKCCLFNLKMVGGKM